MRAFASIIALVLTFSPLGSAAQTRALVPIRVLGGVGGDNPAVPTYAIALGAFKREGLDVTMTGTGGGGAMLAAVAGGSAEVAFSNVVSAVAAIQHGLPVMILTPAVLFTSKAPDILLVKAKGSPLKSGGDLAGKIVGVPTLDGELQLGAALWIAKSGGDPKTVHFVEVPSSSMGAVLKTGRIDAAMMAEPYLAEARSDVEELGDALGAISPLFINSVFVASKPWVASHPEAAKRFVRIMMQTARWANAHHAETAAILAPLANVDAATFNSVTRNTYADALDPALLQPAIDAAFKFGILKQSTDMRTLVAESKPYW